jgi:hypothetical protein
MEETWQSQWEAVEEYCYQLFGPPTCTVLQDIAYDQMGPKTVTATEIRRRKAMAKRNTRRSWRTVETRQ